MTTQTNFTAEMKYAIRNQEGAYWKRNGTARGQWVSSMSLATQWKSADGARKQMSRLSELSPFLDPSLSLYIIV